MLPSLESYLDTVASTVEDLLIPAIDPEQRHIIEQAHLAIASLRFAASRISEAPRLTYRSVEALIADVEEIRELIGSGAADADAAALTARAKAELGPCPAPSDRLNALRADLRAMIARLVDEQSTKAISPETFRRLRELDRKHVLLARVWATPAGFDPEAADLPDLSSLLEQPLGGNDN